jgi:hypothetical protein
MNKTSLHDGKYARLNQRAHRSPETDDEQPTRTFASTAAQSEEPVDGDAGPSHWSEAAQHLDKPLSPCFEPFERCYLDALAEEGIDLNTFLHDWCRAMRDDLDRLADLRRESDFAGPPGLLHRLSGAVGLVGAQSLMEALRQASISLSEHDASSIDALAARTRTLIAQLEAEPAAHRSTRS